jgi:UDP-N-acetylglucosamine kinase
MEHMSDEVIKAAANEFARKNKKAIAKELTDSRKFPPDKIPIAVFMAGSPGAGKTESSRNLIEHLGKNGMSILRIDPDEIRERIPGYSGTNSSLFQGATSIIAEKMQDMALENSQSYVFDSTFANLDAARVNITRNLGHERDVFIVYVYQDPVQAWEFVKAREKKDGRAIPKSVFIQQYFQARCSVNSIKAEFGKKVMIFLVIKNIDGTDFGYRENIDIIDNYLPERYTKEQLEISLHEDI